MKYDILWAKDTNELIEKVNEKLAKGWEPQGGIYSAPIEVEGEYQGYVWVQAIVLDEDE